jgi:hypothetical protein
MCWPRTPQWAAFARPPSGTLLIRVNDQTVPRMESWSDVLRGKRVAMYGRFCDVCQLVQLAFVRVEWRGGKTGPIIGQDGWTTCAMCWGRAALRGT